MTASELNIAIAERCNFDLWLIKKQDAYYRPNASGYTYSIADAWKLPHAEAKRYEMYADRPDVPGCEKVLLEKVPTPDYCADLNACADAEAMLIERKDGQIWRNRTHEYDEWLWWICVPIRNPGREKSHCFPQYATALQRSIALGLTWSLLTQEQADELREGGR